MCHPAKNLSMAPQGVHRHETQRGQRGGNKGSVHVGDDRGRTVTKPLALSLLGLPLSEKQIPQVIENLESGDKPKEVLERTVMRPRQVRYQAALRPDIC